jgi:hypothetical protein
MLLHGGAVIPANVPSAAAAELLGTTPGTAQGGAAAGTGSILSSARVECACSDADGLGPACPHCKQHQSTLSLHFTALPVPLPTASLDCP